MFGRLPDDVSARQPSIYADSDDARKDFGALLRLRRLLDQVREEALFLARHGNHEAARKVGAEVGNGLEAAVHDSCLAAIMQEARETVRAALSAAKTGGE